MALDSGPIMSCHHKRLFSVNRQKLLFSSEVGGSGWAPIEGEQVGESPAFRAGKGQVFPTCEPRGGNREGLEAREQEVLLDSDTTCSNLISLFMKNDDII